MAFVKFWNLTQDKKNPSTLDMYVYGQICSSSSFFGDADDVVAGEFVNDLNKYPDTKVINVHINSPGGSVFAAAAIINQLRKHPACVHTWCEGICASAAVGILLAADKGCRHMSRATLLMIHNPSTRAEGDQETLKKAADLLGKVKNTILSIYTEGTGLSREKLAAMMAAETYLDADEALEANFIDSITEDTPHYDIHDNAGTLICNGIHFDVAATLDMGKLREKLDRVLAHPEDHNNTVNEGGSIPMNFEDVLSTLDEESRNAINEHIAALQEGHTEHTAQMVQEHEVAMQAMRDANDAQLAQINELQAKMSAIAQPADNASAEDAVINSMSPEAQTLLAQARADAVAAQKALQEMQDRQEFTEFRATFAEFDNLPLQDTHIKAMQTLAKSDADMFKDLRELLRVANVAMGENFKAKGSDVGTDVAVDAWTMIEQKISAYRAEHPEANYNDAMRSVFKDNPDLYNQYREGINHE